MESIPKIRCLPHEEYWRCRAHRTTTKTHEFKLASTEFYKYEDSQWTAANTSSRAPEASQCADERREGTGHTVGPEIQRLKSCQGAHRSRNPASHSVVLETQHPAARQSTSNQRMETSMVERTDGSQHGEAR